MDITDDRMTDAAVSFQTWSLFLLRNIIKVREHWETGMRSVLSLGPTSNISDIKNFRDWM
jgi:hypothetical protein